MKAEHCSHRGRKVARRRSNSGSFLLSASRLVCDSAGEDGRIGVFIVGGDYICPGRDKGRCREQ